MLADGTSEPEDSVTRYRLQVTLHYSKPQGSPRRDNFIVVNPSEDRPDSIGSSPRRIKADKAAQQPKPQS